MGLIRNIKDMVHTGTSITLVVFGILELISLLIAIGVAYIKMQNGEYAEAIELWIIFFVYWIIQQIYVFPITFAIEKLHNWSK